MEFEWDEAKSERTLQERGFDFTFASQIFRGHIIEWEDIRLDYRERRMVAVGKVENVFVTLVYNRPRTRPSNHRGVAVQPKGAQVMAVRRMSFDEVMARKGRVNRAKLEATTEEDIRRYQIEDGYDPDAPLDGSEPVVLPQAVRKKLAMTQEEFARALRIPVATLRNWEQGRVRPDPAARSLLLAVYRNPKAVLAALAA